MTGLNRSHLGLSNVDKGRVGGGEDAVDQLGVRCVVRSSAIRGRPGCGQADAVDSDQGARLQQSIDVFWGALAMLMWGVADYLAFRYSQRIGSYATAFYVQVLGLVPPLLLLPFWLGTVGTSGPLDWASLVVITPLLALFWLLGYVAFYRGMERGMVSIVSGVTSAWLVVAILLAALLFGEAVTLTQALLVVLVTAAIVSLGLQSNSPTSPRTGLWYGVAAMFAMGAAMALWMPLTDAVGPGIAVIPPKVITAVLMWAVAKVGNIKLPWPEPGERWLLIVAAMLDSLGIIALTIGIHGGSFPIVAALGAAHPVVTIAMAMLFAHERPARAQLASMAIAIGGVITLSSITG